MDCPAIRNHNIDLLRSGGVMDARGSINRTLVRLFRRINDLEEKAICRDKLKNVTINEIHVVEAIGAGESRNMSAVAKDLDVTTGTLTISVNSLVKKGLVGRVRSDEDRRVVLVSLTELGLEAYNRHLEFHRRMVDTITAKLEEDEVIVLGEALGKLDDFFVRTGGQHE